MAPRRDMLFRYGEDEPGGLESLALAGQLFGGQPDEGMDESAFMPDPADYEVPIYEPEQFQGGRRGLLESLGGLEGLDLPTPTSFGEGFAYGLGGGLGRAGTRVQQQRQKFEADQQRRAAMADQDRISASRQLRADTGAARRARDSEQARTRREREKYLQDTRPVQADDPAWVKRRADAEGRIHRTDLPGEPKAEKTLKEEEDIAAARARGAVRGGGTSVTPEQAAILAGIVQTTGMFPPMGRGGIGSPTGQAILGAFGDQGAGQSPADIGRGIGAAKGTFGATSGALRNIETSIAQQTVFTNKLKKNTDRLREAAKHVADLGPQFANRPIRAALGQLGSANQAAFRAALLPVSTESARLLTSGPALGGQLTEGARKELESIVSGDFNLRQLNAVLDILENDAANGLAAYGAQRDALRQQLGAGAAPAAKSGGWFQSNAPRKAGR